MRLLGIVLLIALVVPVARAEPPEGFRGSWPLTKRAATLSGKPDARVYCATTIAAWSAKTEGRTHLRGLTSMKTREVSLPRAVCRTLEGQLAGRAFLPRLLAYHLHVFGHEVQHVAGWEDEWTANCLAMKRFPAVARAFGIRSPARAASLRRILVARGECS